MRHPEVFGEIRRRLSLSRRILIACHRDPDGDTLGSGLGLALHLFSMGIEPLVVCNDNIPPSLDMLPGQQFFISGQPHCHSSRLDVQFDVAIAVDSGDADRLGLYRDIALGSPILINIDHHRTNPNYGRINCVIPDASATAEIVYNLITDGKTAESWVSELSPEVSSALYVGLMTDTGCFRYANTSAAALDVAAGLVRSGAKPGAIAEIVYERKSFESLRLLGGFLQSLRRECNGELVWAVLKQSDLVEYGVSEDDIDGLAGYARMAREAKVAAVFREMADHTVKVSLRSRDAIDVDALAHSLGGGGHRKAAGATIAGTLDEVAQRVVGRLKSLLGVNQL